MTKIVSEDTAFHEYDAMDKRKMSDEDALHQACVAWLYCNGHVTDSGNADPVAIVSAINCLYRALFGSTRQRYSRERTRDQETNLRRNVTLRLLKEGM